MQFIARGKFLQQNVLNSIQLFLGKPLNKQQYHSNSHEVKEQAIWKALHVRKQNYFHFCIYGTFNKKRDENCGIHI